MAAHARQSGGPPPAALLPLPAANAVQQDLKVTSFSINKVLPAPPGLDSPHANLPAAAAELLGNVEMPPEVPTPREGPTPPDNTPPPSDYSLTPREDTAGKGGRQRRSQGRRTSKINRPKQSLLPGTARANEMLGFAMTTSRENSFTRSPRVAGDGASNLDLEESRAEEGLQPDPARKPPAKAAAAAPAEAGGHRQRKFSTDIDMEAMEEGAAPDDKHSSKPRRASALGVLWSRAKSTVGAGAAAGGGHERGSRMEGVVRAAYRKARQSTFKHVDYMFTRAPVGPKKAKIYDPQDNIRNIFVWHGTAIKLVVYKMDFWFLLVLHIFLQMYYYGFQCSYPAAVAQPEWCGRDTSSQPTRWPVIEIGTLLILGSFLTFFVVFFNSQAYARFFQEYFIVCKIRYAVNDAFFLVRLHGEVPAVVFNTLRMLHAAVYLGFTNLSQNKELVGFENMMHDRVVKLKLLTVHESERLRAMEHSNPAAECLLWGMRELKDLLELKKLSVPIYRAIEAQFMKIRLHFDELVSYNDQPIPFVYYHLVNIIVELYLLVVCYAATFVTPYYSIIGYFGTLIGLLGLREAASALAEPLGLDETDIPVFAMATENHFEQVYIATRMDSRGPGNLYKDLNDLAGFGGNANLEHVTEGVDMDGFETQEALEKLTTFEKFSRALGDPPAPKQPNYPVTPKGRLTPAGPPQTVQFWNELMNNQAPDADEQRRMGADMPVFNPEDSDEEFEEEDFGGDNEESSKHGFGETMVGI